MKTILLLLLPTLSFAGGGYIGSGGVILNNVTGTLGVGNGGTGSTSFTSGSVVFSTTPNSGTNILSQNNANLFWDNVNNRLGIDTYSPQTTLHILGTSSSRAILVNSPAPTMSLTSGITAGEFALFATSYSATQSSMLDLLSYSTSTSQSAGPMYRITNHWENSGGPSSSGTIAIGSYVGTTFTDVLNITTQNFVGVGIAVPASTFSVAGRIESTLGGYKFPDATIQTTAFPGALISTAAIHATASTVNNTVNAGCNIAGSTITLSACGSAVKIKYTVTLHGDSGSTNQRMFLNATMDSLAFPGLDYANKVAMHCTVAPAASSEADCSFTFTTAATQTNASHSFCIGVVNGTGANNTTWPASSGVIAYTAECMGN